MSIALRLYQSIGVMAWVKVHRYLGALITNRMNDRNFLASYYFDIYTYNDVDLNKDKAHKNAQLALDWLMINESVLDVCWIASSNCYGNPVVFAVN